VAAYCLISASIAVYFSCTNVLHSSSLLLFLYCLFGAVMILSAARATLANPTDRVVYSYKWSLQEKRVTFVVDYERVLYCLHCDSYCLATSKHCRVCNRCVSNFDHHCMWFNNCVGDRNYPSFFISLFATLSYALIAIVHTAIATFQVDFSDPAQLLRILLSWVIAGILAVFAFLLSNLIILHIYLWATNQTTYQFLQRKKKEEAEAIKAKENEEAKQTASINQLVPERTKDKQVDIHSEDSYANTKVITVHPTAKTTEETPQKEQRNFSEEFE
jgi:palmitoyltransferase ZDHHC1/11